MNQDGNMIIEFSGWNEDGKEELACLLESAAATVRRGGDSGESFLDGKLVGKWQIRFFKPTKRLTTDH